MSKLRALVCAADAAAESFHRRQPHSSVGEPQVQAALRQLQDGIDQLFGLDQQLLDDLLPILSPPLQDAGGTAWFLNGVGINLQDLELTGAGGCGDHGSAEEVFVEQLLRGWIDVVGAESARRMRGVGAYQFYRKLIPTLKIRTKPGGPLWADTQPMQLAFLKGFRIGRSKLGR